MTNLPAWLREQADNAERTDPHGHMDVSMALSYAADALRRAAAALDEHQADPARVGSTEDGTGIGSATPDRP
jgi:hypothetical protein